MPHDQNPLAAAAQLAVQVVAAFRLGDPARPEAQAAELLLQEVAAAVRGVLALKGRGLQLHEPLHVRQILLGLFLQLADHLLFKHF